MRRSGTNDQLQRLLSVQEDTSDEAQLVRVRAQAVWWARDKRQGLIICLANRSFIPEQGFMIMEHVRGPKMDAFELLHITALGELLGITVDDLLTAVTVLPMHDPEAQPRYSAFLSPTKLKELCCR